MIHLTYSNRTESLLDALARRLDARRDAGRQDGSDPLEPVWILVPNRNVERFVELGIARTLGIAANLRFLRLAGFVRSWLEPEGSTLLLEDALTARVLRAMIDDELLLRPPMAPVRRYLAGAGEDPDAIDLRRAQLALHVARLFEEYAFSRPELLDAWTSGRHRFAEGPHASAHRGTEAWQSELWRWVREVPGPRAGRALTLSEALAATRARAGDHAEGGAPMRELHVFGLSYVARVFSQVFAAHGERADLYLYALNPCEEFWEDLETDGELRRRRRRDDTEPEWLFEDDDPFRLSVETETPLLRLWGRPGREHVRLLGALTDCDFEPRFVDPKEERREATDASLPLFSRLQEPTLLSRLQHDVLARAPRPVGVSDAAHDESLVVLACPSVRREVETVAAEIWSMLEVVDGLTFDQIAVLVNGPDRDLYLPHLSAVFEEAHRIPFNVADLTLASVSPIVEGALRLLELPTTGFTRPDVLAVVTHPAVRAVVPDVEPHEWVALTDRLGIFHGLDHDALAGTYVGDDDLLSWEQGLTRIALGAFVSGERTGEPGFVELEGRRYLPEEPAVGEVTDARFALLVRSLMSDVRFCREAELSLSEWSRFLVAMLTSYLHVPASGTDARSSMAQEEAALRRATSALEALARLDLDGAKVRYTIAHELAKGALEALGGGRGQQLADGVAVSSLMPMRAIPFRVIFVLGLGEGRFPAPDRRDSMDLRAARRLVGDVTPPERDRYTFLETVLCARERLVLSYVARDEQTGDELAPSSVVAELLDVVEQGYLRGARERLVRRAVPLRRHEEAALARVLPEASAERRARRLGRALFDSLAEEGRESVLNQLSPSEIARRVVRVEGMRDVLGLAELPERSVQEVRSSVLRISLSALRKFLECPLQGWTRAVLRLEQDAVDTSAALADEPFEPSLLDATLTLRAAFVEAALGERSMADAYHAHATLQRAHGRWPIGALEELEAAQHAQILGRWETAWAGLGPASSVGRVRFGAAHASDASEEARDPIVLLFDDDPRDPGSGRPLRVEVSGRTELLRHGPLGGLVASAVGRASITPLVRRSTGAKGRVDELRYALRAFFDHAALSCADGGSSDSGSSDGGRAGPAHASVQLLGDVDLPPALVPFAPLAAPVARAWLSGLVHDLLARPHAYLLPVEAVLRVADRFDAVRGEELLESIEVVRERWGGGQSRYGPVRDAPERYAPPPLGELEEMVERRFGLPIRALEGGGS